jgi:uncharacterized radical SAM superfamily Fe-S cluster-containing enzyme
MSAETDRTVSVLNDTEAYCPVCNTRHPAHYESRGNHVFFCVNCPKQSFETCVSTDAARFCELRDRSLVDYARTPPHAPFRVVNIVLITNACNFRCNFCYASASPKEDAEFISVARLRHLAAQLQREGCYTVSLCGGEPTLHPELFEIIALMRRRRIMVTLVSNGYRIGTEPELAKSLKRAGVKTVALQFDTLDPETHRRYRNNTFIEEQKQAIRNCVEAGLRVAVTVTVSTHNLDQLVGVTDYLLQFQPRLHMIAYQPLFSAGHLGDDFGPERKVCREDVIEACGHSNPWGLRGDHFWPIPAAPAFNVQVHPDCGAIAALCRTRDETVPLDKLVDVSALCKAMAQNSGSVRHYLQATLQLALLVLRFSRPGKRRTLAACLFGLLTGRGRSGIVILPIESITDSACYDIQRTQRCATALRRLDGRCQEGCFPTDL